MTLPSAEELARTCTEPIYISLNVKRIRALQARVADAIRADRRAVLEAVIELLEPCYYACDGTNEKAIRKMMEEL